MNATPKIKRYRIPLRSKLYDWISELRQEKATARQWIGMFNNLHGIRREEIDRTIIMKALFTYETDEVIERSEIVEAIEQQLAICIPTLNTFSQKTFRPTLAVRTVLDQLPKRVEPKARRFVEKAQNCYQHPSMGYWIIRTGYEDLATVAPNWIVLDHKGKMLRSHARHGGWFPSALEAFDEMHRTIRLRFGKFGSERPLTIFDQYTFLGGNNYQEWFICLPDWPLPYQDGHFNLKQLLVHIRTTERIDQEGNPLLMVEEIQSPWHADIHKHGSTTKTEEIGKGGLVADAPFGKEWHELAIKTLIGLAIFKGHTRLGFTTGMQQCERWWDMQGLKNLYDLDIPKCLKRVASQYDCVNDWASIITRKPVGRLTYKPERGWIVQDTNKLPLSPPVMNKDVALFYLNERSTPVKEQVRLLEISSALKQAWQADRIPLFGW